METFYLEKHPHVELCDLLKFMGWCESGAAAKAVIAEGQVKVNGQVETAQTLQNPRRPTGRVRQQQVGGQSFC
ncbi:ribosome-associated protein YbcJ (S4-like RNA binding protein) [Ewingella americana]